MVIHNYIIDIKYSIIDIQNYIMPLWVNMLEDPLISFQCVNIATHNAIILHVHDPIMNGIPNCSMDIHMQLWMWYPYMQWWISILFKNYVRMSLNELRISIIGLQISIFESLIELGIPMIGLWMCILDYRFPWLKGYNYCYSYDVRETITNIHYNTGTVRDIHIANKIHP